MEGLVITGGPYGEGVQIEHDEYATVSGGRDDHVHYLERGESNQIGVGSVVHTPGSGVVDC
jgi:hypothetical protein